MANTFIIKEEVLNEVANIMKPTESQFNSNVRYFLHQLIADPVHAEIPTCIKMANISRSRFIKMLIDRGIVNRTERLNDTDKDGNHKTPTMAVKYTIINKIPDELEYKVSKTDFDRRVEKLRRSIFEKNLPQKKFNTPLGDQLAIAKNSPLTMGFITPGEKKHDAASWLMNRAAEALNASLVLREGKEFNDEQKEIIKIVDKAISNHRENGSEHTKDMIRGGDYDIDEYGTFVLKLNGGLNGSGDWMDYFEALSDFCIELEHNGVHIWFIDGKNDCLDDVYDFNFGLKKKNDELNEEGGDGGATSADASGAFVQPLFKTMVRREINEMIEALSPNSELNNRYRNLGGGFEVHLEDGSVEQSIVTVQNKKSHTLYHICFDGVNFNIFRDANDGMPATHISYVFDELFNAFQQSGFTNMNEDVDELAAKHSSGANFNKFDSSHMGSGCGSQVYGWGHYVSTDRKVSNGYRDHFKQNPHYQGGLKYGAYTYDVEIPEDNGRNYILWDGKPLPNLPFADHVKTFGEQYELMANVAGSSPKDVSLKLADMGYTGIKVLPYRNRTAENDRTKFNKGANYVIFKDDDIKINKKKEYSSKARRYGNYYLIRNEANRGNLYDPKTNQYVFNDPEWPYLRPLKDKNFIKVDYVGRENVLCIQNMKYVYPTNDMAKWPTLTTVPDFGGCQFYYAQWGNKIMAYKNFTMDNLFGDDNDSNTWAYDVEYDYPQKICKFKCFTKESNFKDIVAYYVNNAGKVSTKERDVYTPIQKVKWALSQPVFKESVNNNGRVFKVTEEQMRLFKESTATPTVGGAKTNYQYTVPFPTDSNDETMKRHNGEGGSVSINHIQESNKESLHTSNVGDYINDNPIGIHPEDPTMKRGEGKHGSHGVERIEEGKKYVNMDVELRKGGRNAVKMSVDDFKNEMTHAYHEYAMEQGKEYKYDLQKTPTPSNFVYSLCYDNRDNEKSKIASMLHKDIWEGKYDFDSENVDAIGGIKMSKNGFPYIQCDAGGDWECPVCFFVYFDGNHFRAYVPLKGNALNRNDNHAFSGGGNENDAKFVQKELGISYEEADGLCGDINYNLDACLEDFLSRVEVKGTYKKRDYTNDEKKFDEYRKKKKEEREERDRQREEQSVEYGEPDSNTATPLNEEQNKFLEKHGIKEVSCGLGYSEKEQKWYGWSHRAIHGFGIGDKGVECYPTGSKEGKIIKTMEQAKEAAKKFAESVS